MAKPKVTTTKTNKKKRLRPTLTPEAQENRMISLAVDLAEKKLLDGTAPSTVIVHYLKLGSMKEQLELEKLKKENELLHAKTEALQSMQVTEELYKNAIDVMRTYSGAGGSSDE